MLHPTKNEDGEIVDFEFMEGTIHFICIGWKLFFSLVPPAHYANGWACFYCSLAMIGVVTAIVEKVATLFGCVLGVPPPITAVTFVALGTSLPDTFASMTAAKQEKYADAAIGNVTGSNSVNVFLGLGLPWVVAVTFESGKYGHLPDYEGYYVPAAALGFNVVVFSCLAIVCIIFLLFRRWYVGGELGGSNPFRTVSATFLISLWVIYVLMVIM
jgi:solute carrier family 8 (sodium/calcium exchanger)